MKIETNAELQSWPLEMLHANLKKSIPSFKNICKQEISCTNMNKFSTQQPCWSLTGELLLNLVLGLILFVKPANGNLMNHCDPLVVLKGVFSELILFITCSENCIRLLLCFSHWPVWSLLFSFLLQSPEVCFHFINFCQVNRSNYFFPIPPSFIQAL